MTKYNKYPKPNIKKPTCKQLIKNDVSPLCCLPILLGNSKGYENMVNSLDDIKTLLPLSQKMQIYQMLYMDNLMEKLQCYSPKMESSNFDEIITNLGLADTMKKVSAFQKFSHTHNIKDLLCLIDNPMVNMLLPFLDLSIGNANSMDNALSSLMPMLMGGGLPTDMLGGNSSMLNMLSSILK